MPDAAVNKSTEWLVHSPLVVFFDPFALFLGAFFLLLSGLRIFAIVFAVGGLLELIVYYIMRSKMFSDTTDIVKASNDFANTLNSYLPVQTWLNFALTIIAALLAIVNAFMKGGSSNVKSGGGRNKSRRNRH
jgi:hypothetical protein